MDFPRASGILLHPTSLPGQFGIGDLGPQAYAFADFLVEAGQSLWQVLPLGPTGYGDSPYACYSAFAGNTLLISPEQLIADGLLSSEDLPSTPPASGDRVDYEKANHLKDALLSQAFSHYQSSPVSSLREEFEKFTRENAHWLDDYSLFVAVRKSQGGQGGSAWHDWEESIAKRNPERLNRLRNELSEEINAEKFFQFLFFRQWFELKAYCNDRGISIIGDIPIFVAFDSADVWTNPDQFKLDESGLPLVVAGVPPDYFSETGQFWGNPIYDWDRMREDGFAWWVARMRGALRMFDVVRVDHFRGFAACWEIPAQDKTAERGRWVEAPGAALFAALENELGELPIIAEDLGVITPDVEKLRDALHFPGMRILQFAFGSDAQNLSLPHNYQRNLVVYTGTHDNDTTVGWFNSLAGQGSTRSKEEIEKERSFCLKYLDSDGSEIHWDFIRAALASVAHTAIVPLQDVLGLGTEARMNLPNSVDGNWRWRFAAGVLNQKLTARLRELNRLYGR